MGRQRGRTGRRGLQAAFHDLHATRAWPTWSTQKKTFKDMSVENGINGIVTPLHPGAEKFWKEKGVLK